MALYLLDSDASIDILNGFRPTIDEVRGLSERGDRICACDIVIAEVISGLRPDDRRGAIRFFDACVMLPSAAEIAIQAGIWRYRHARQGTTLATTDTLIAAIAHRYGAAIVTRNTRDYPMPEVRLHPLPPSR